jgi:hypothetical protein
MKDNMSLTRASRYRHFRHLAATRAADGSVWCPMKTTRVHKGAVETDSHSIPGNKPPRKVSSHRVVEGVLACGPVPCEVSRPRHLVAEVGRCTQLPARNGRRKRGRNGRARHPRTRCRKEKPKVPSTPNGGGSWFTVRVDVAPTEARVVEGRNYRPVVGSTSGGVGPGTWTQFRAVGADPYGRGSKPNARRGQRVEYPVVGPFKTEWFGVVRHRTAWKLRKQSMSQGHRWWRFSLIDFRVSRSETPRRHAAKVSFWPKPTPVKRVLAGH